MRTDLNKRLVNAIPSAQLKEGYEEQILEENSYSEYYQKRFQLILDGWIPIMSSAVWDHPDNIENGSFICRLTRKKLVKEVA